MRGRSRCRYHGGLASGPTSEAGKLRQRVSRWTDGARSAAGKELRRAYSALVVASLAGLPTEEARQRVRRASAEWRALVAQIEKVKHEQAMQEAGTDPEK